MKIPVLQRLALSALVLIGAVLSQTSTAQAPAPLAVSQSPSATVSDTTPTKTMEGKVQKVELNLEKLRDAGLDLKNLLKAASGLYDEVTVQPVRLITEPEVIGRGTVINIPIGTQPIGPPRPARKERVDLCMSGIRPTVDLMKKNVDEYVGGGAEIDLPPEVLQELQPDFQQWVKQVNVMAASEGQLEQLTIGPTYDNQGIAAVTASIEQQVKDLDETRRKIYKVIRKEGKRIAAFDAGH